MSESELLNLAQERVIVLDGAMGTSLQQRDLASSDYRGLENCSEILTLTRPDVLGDVHRSFLTVGCDAVLTNTFGANQVVLAEFNLADRVHEINTAAARIARQACADFAQPGRPRFVIGSIGPGTRLPSLQQITWDELVDAYRVQALGLLEGGVDALLIETSQDILQAKSAVVGASDALAESGVEVPILCTVTIETTGTMLVGTEIAAALTTLRAYPQVAAIGLNCATGPQEMSEHVRYLSKHCARPLIVQPNAGLPQMIGGRPDYPLKPEELARWLTEFVEVDGVSFVGGCCGTTPEHLAAVVDALKDHRPAPRDVRAAPSVSSLYQSVTIRQDTDCLMIGERTNANGSKRFRELLAEEDWDGIVQMARGQMHQGSHLLDVCTAYAGRDEAEDMCAVVKRLVTDVTVPLVLDSTEVSALEAGLKLVGGKCVINSINLEDGEERLDRICGLAKRYGAALIVLTIDEEGMAKTCARKVAVAQRIYRLATERHGINPSDLIVDPLTFTICTGNDEDRGLARETLEALGSIKEACPGAHTVLGLSNVSFGVKPPVRRVLNSVFLHHARENGLDAAILHSAGILPLYKIDETHRRMAEDLIYDRRGEDYDPLRELLEAFAEVDGSVDEEAAPPKSVEDRLKLRVIAGERRGLEDDLEEAMLTHRPLDIVNEILLDAMKTVGDLFGAGQMQLPFVLQSAETMKAAVRCLEPHMDQVEAGRKGTIVLATVRGDVHDIGGNLVDIILSNNGYRVINLGVKQPISRIIDAYHEHDADAIGMSGLLVKSALVMRENLRVLSKRGIDAPVIVGGAALTRRYVEEDLKPVYAGPLFYAKDAFAGLSLMERITSWRPAKRKAVATAVPVLQAAGGGPPGSSPEELPVEAAPRPGFLRPESDISRDEPVPQPPFFGSVVVEHIDPRAALEYLNENTLFAVQWQYRRGRRRPEEYARHVNDEIRPILRDLLQTCQGEGILRPQAVYGFWPAQADGDTLAVYDPKDQRRQLATFEFPRMSRPPYWCISDFFRPTGGGICDVVAFCMVTVGRRVSEVAREWLAADRYQDYLHLHGLGVALAEALVEYIHRQIRVQWGIAGQDARNCREILNQHYRGS